MVEGDSKQVKSEGIIREVARLLSTFLGPCRNVKKNNVVWGVTGCPLGKSFLWKRPFIVVRS